MLKRLVQIWIKTSYGITTTTETLTRKELEMFYKTKKPTGEVTLKKKRKKFTFKSKLEHRVEI